MTKAIRMMQENIKLIDIIIELTDARIPAAGSTAIGSIKDLPKR